MCTSHKHIGHGKDACTDAGSFVQHSSWVGSQLFMWPSPLCVRARTHNPLLERSHFSSTPSALSSLLSPRGIRARAQSARAKPQRFRASSHCDRGCHSRRDHFRTSRELLCTASLPERSVVTCSPHADGVIFERRTPPCALASFACDTSRPCNSRWSPAGRIAIRHEKRSHDVHHILRGRFIRSEADLL